MRIARILILPVALMGIAFAQPRRECCEKMSTHLGGMHGMMGHGMSCDQMAARLEVRIEDVPGGAVIHVQSRDPAMVDQARTIVHGMMDCMFGKEPPSR